MVPKFRAWDKRENTMRDVAVLHFNKGGKVNYIEYWKTPSELKSYHVRNLFLMQSTGLKDKNGVEIFEGDVLLDTSSSANYSDTYWHSYVQVYRADSGAYRIKGKHIYDTELMSARNRLEVVGSIYQHQKLLEKEYFSTSDGIVERADEN
ncbi:YopX family protein [Enterococcus casseliflavus]|uniref:YopX family protein n=1 Tax=Enterococcus casseliflavus TaxID=37734 RepID=UPI0039A6B093